MFYKSVILLQEEGAIFHLFYGALFQVSKLFLEIFECIEIQGVIFLQTVVNFVSTPLYR